MNLIGMFPGHQSPLFCHIVRQEWRPAATHQPAVNQRRVFQRCRLRQVLRRRTRGCSRVYARAWCHSPRSQTRKHTPQWKAPYLGEDIVTRHQNQSCPFSLAHSKLTNSSTFFLRSPISAARRSSATTATGFGANASDEGPATTGRARRTVTPTPGRSQTKALHQCRVMCEYSSSETLVVSLGN